MYFYYTVEIEISSLAINTILVADELKNLDREASKLSTTQNEENMSG